jgi:hypothetical protein
LREFLVLRFFYASGCRADAARVGSATTPLETDPKRLQAHEQSGPDLLDEFRDVFFSRSAGEGVVAKSNANRNRKMLSRRHPGLERGKSFFATGQIVLSLSQKLRISTRLGDFLHGFVTPLP